MEVLKKIMGYISFKKADPNETSNSYLKAMHGINKVSILVFLCAVIYLIIRAALK